MTWRLPSTLLDARRIGRSTADSPSVAFSIVSAFTSCWTIRRSMTRLGHGFVPASRAIFARPLRTKARSLAFQAHRRPELGGQDAGERGPQLVTGLFGDPG